MPSMLLPQEQKIVARRLTEEYRYLGVLYAAALECVAKGDWDDHPLAAALLRRRAEAQDEWATLNFELRRRICRACKVADPDTAARGDTVPFECIERLLSI